MIKQTLLHSYTPPPPFGDPPINKGGIKKDYYNPNAFIASRVIWQSSSTVMPSISAPLPITSLEQPAAKAGVLYFFITLLSSISWQDLLGLIRAAAPIRPVSSSVAKRYFSII